MSYKAGDIICHKLSNQRLMVLKMGKEQVLCRTIDLREVWFYTFELKEAE